MQLNKKNPLLSGKNTVILITLIILIISALPNFYQPQAHINMAFSKPDNAVHLNTSQALLAQQGIKLTSAKQVQDQVELALSDVSQTEAALDVLSQHYGEAAVIDSRLIDGLPSWLSALNLQAIKLGLDLSGGVLFVLEVDIEQAMDERLDSIITETKSIARAEKMRGLKLKKANNKREGSYIELKLSHRAKDSINELWPQLQSVFPKLVKQRASDRLYSLSYSPQAVNEFRLEVMKQTLTIMRGRIQELGITEAVVQKQGKTRIRIELPGVHNMKEAQRVIGATASLAFYQLAEHSNAVTTKRIVDKQGRALVLNAKAIFSGENINNARAGHDESGFPLVNLSLDKRGGRLMSEFTKKNIGKPMVTVFSEYYRNEAGKTAKTDKVINAATIQAHLGSQFSITNMGSSSEARDLALLLRAGSLTAPVTIVQSQNIGASLGEENIQNGVYALLAGMLITLVFMALWYRSFGLIANVALSFNLLVLLGLMSLIPGSVLTLPGIAGLVLTVGMAVDTNVLIFERIKEELRQGRPSLIAIERGYDNAFVSIVDANITTLITAIILYGVGYGPVKGFALVLSLGILSSLFTGVFVSKLISNLLFRKTVSHLMGVK